jgi:exopolyphosphatase/guanosine-5'-triphosphate,3'-diphosphate pyrophosphatase
LPSYAAIDVGSHSCKLRVAHRSARGWRSDLDRVIITGLGAGEPATAGLDPAGRARTLAALAEFLDLTAPLAPAATVAVGTAVLRRAADAADFAAEVADRLQVALEIISGEEEARLTRLGAVASLPPVAGDCQLVVDIGGASTEIAWSAGRRSLDLGTITLTRAHGLDRAVDDAALDAARAAVHRQLDTLPPLPAPVRTVGIGASPASILALARGRDLADSDQVHGTELEPAEIARQIAVLRDRDADARRNLPGLHPGRAAVVLAGALITAAVAERWPDTPLVLSAFGLRLGVLMDRFQEPD